MKPPRRLSKRPQRPYSTAKGDQIAALYEEIAAEEKARDACQWLINMTDVDLIDSLTFLHEREVY